MQTVNYLNTLDSLITASNIYEVRGQVVTAAYVKAFINEARSKGMSDFNIAKMITVRVSDDKFKLVSLINQTNNYATTNPLQQSYRRA